MTPTSHAGGSPRGAAVARAGHVLAALALGVVIAALLGCERYERLEVLPPGSLQTHYLVDLEYLLDADAGFGTIGHLVVFNPGRRAATLDVTAYFEDREPTTFRLEAPAGGTKESSYREWPITPGTRFALKVVSSEPVVAQVTMGWNNTANDTIPLPARPREAATSYQSIRELATRWYVADGIVIDAPKALWFRESEWAIVLNPSDQPATVDMRLFYRVLARSHTIEVPPRRVRAVKMDDVVLRAGLHYGVRFASDVPVAVQWRRTVNWYDSPELMAFWSVPAVALAPVRDPGAPEPR